MRDDTVAAFGRLEAEPDLFRVMDGGVPAGRPDLMPRAPECTPRPQILIGYRWRLRDLAGVVEFSRFRAALARVSGSSR